MTGGEIKKMVKGTRLGGLPILWAEQNKEIVQLVK